MKEKVNAKAKEIFRNDRAIELYNRFKNDSNVFESGVDSNGKIYFAFLNGNVERYNRREFVRMANDPEI